MPINNGPIWALADEVPQQYPWLDSDERCGICVVGGGLTGALCALRLAEQGEDVVLITAKQIGFGATANTMPCVEYDGGTTLYSMGRQIGRDNAAVMLELGRRAIDSLEDIAFSLGERCKFVRRDCLLFTDDSNTLDILNKEYTARQNAGFDCSYISRNTARDVFSFNLLGGIVSKGLGAELDPYMFTQLCIEKAVSLGARVFENTKAVRLDMNGENVRIETSTFRIITADRVVVASGSACSDVFDGLISPRTYFMAVSKPVRQFTGWPGRCVIRTLDSPRLTISVSPDDRICICGLDSSVVDELSRLGGILPLPTLHEKRFEELTGYVKYMFPQIHVPEFEAFSAFRGCRSADGMPVVGFFGDQPNCMFAACCGAGGVLMSVTVSETIAMLCAGEETELADFFSPERRSLKK